MFLTSGKMTPRWTYPQLSLLCLLLASVSRADDTPPGLVAKDSEQDLVAEASNTAPQAQKREASLSNSYGEPIPSDAYGPPRDIPLNEPAPVYGVPDLQVNVQTSFHHETPPGAYGPPQPIVFPAVSYEGPPPPPQHAQQTYGPPKPLYGPPKQTYGPPKPIYGPPKKNYGPPKQSLPKPTYGAPFKPPKFGFPKTMYGVPKPVYGPPKPIYGPPKATYGPPHTFDLPPISLPPNFGIFGNGGFGQNPPAPIYGTPLTTLPLDLKPNFPIPADTYGPPGHSLGPVGPSDQIVVQEVDQHISGHYGPPQPDPDPRPPHPGIPAPPTPPRVLYDGWKPIPGLSKPLFEHNQHQQHQQQQQHQHHQQHQQQQIHGDQDQYGPPPPPPPVNEIDLDAHSLPNVAQPPPFINTGYSSVHQDVLANLDLNSIVGGDTNHIDQSKTVFEAHYTEGGNAQGSNIAIVQTPEKPSDSYGAPPSDSFTSSGPYPTSLRQHGAKILSNSILTPPSGIYGVPPGSQYGAPPRPPPSNLPIPYGSYSGGGHSGGHSPKRPIKFRESVPEGLLQQIGHVTSHKDSHGFDHVKQGPAYLPPPIRDVKDVNQFTGNHGVSFSIEPSSLFSLPHAGNPINFNAGQQQPSDLYGSPIDSYAAPLLTVSDHTASGSSANAVTATLDGTLLTNLSSLDAAAILKHCPYHEAILRAAQRGEKVPSDLASSYVASLSSLGSTLSKSQQTLFSPQNGFNTPEAGSESVSYSTKDLATASHTLVQTIVPPNNNEIKGDKLDKSQKGKSLKTDNGKQHAFKDDERLNFVNEQIYKTSQKIKSLSEETKQLQQKIVSTSQNLNNFGQQEIPVKGNLGTYSLQIQSADGGKGQNVPSVPHEQLLSEGLLQSILSAIEQPATAANHNKPVQVQNQKINFHQSSIMDLSDIGNGGLVLPAGYEPVDRTKQVKQTIKINEPQYTDQEIQSTHKNIQQILNSEIVHRGDIPECELRGQHSHRHSVVVPPPSDIEKHRHSVVVPPPSNVEKVAPVEEIQDNDVAIYFGESQREEVEKERQEPVTEISVATSISEEDPAQKEQKKPEFGDKVENKQ